MAMVQLEEPPPYLLCAVALPSYSMCLCGVTRPAQGPSGKLASQRLLGCLSSHVPQHSPLALHPVLNKAEIEMPPSHLLPLQVGQAGLGL